LKLPACTLGFVLTSAVSYHADQAMVASKVALAIATLAVSTSAIELTPANFDEKTAGKSVFIKFLAPW